MPWFKRPKPSSRIMFVTAARMNTTSRCRSKVHRQLAEEIEMTRATGTDRTALADRIESGLGEGLREGTLPRGMFLAPVDWLHVLEALRCSGPLGEGWRDPKDKPPHLPGEHHS